MSTNYSPKIVTNGLVMYFDAANQNSLATINLYGDISSSLFIRSPLTEYNTNNWAAPFSPPPENIGRVYKHTSGALSSNWGGNEYGYTLKLYTYTSGLTYTLSCWIYISTDCDITSIYCNMESTTLIDTTYQYADMSKKGQWQQISVKCNSATNINGNAIPIYPYKLGVTDGSFAGFYAWGGAQLEQISRSWVDLSGNSNNGEIINNITYTSDNKGCLVFDGLTNTRVQTTYNINTLQDFTVCIWFKDNGSTSYGRLIDARYDVGFFLAQNGGAPNSWGGGIAESNQPYGIFLTLQDSDWNFLVSVRRQNVHTLYGNGITNTISNTVTSNLLGSFTMAIGSWTGGHSQCFKGKIPLVMLYNRALYPTEILQNYNEFKGRFGL